MLVWSVGAVRIDLVELVGCRWSISKKHLFFSVQTLVKHNFENTTNMEKGFLCSNCKNNDVIVTEKRCILGAPTDILFVIKRYQFESREAKKVSINIGNEQVISIPHRNDINGTKLDDKYHLRSIICHSGETYMLG